MSFSASVASLVEESLSPLVACSPSWRRVGLGEMAEILNGFPWKSVFFNEHTGSPVIRIRDVTSGATETRYNGEITEGFWVEDGDLLVGMDGDFTSRIWNGGRALLNQRVCRITPHEAYYLKKFLALTLPGYLQLIHGETHSITVKHLSSRTLSEIPLPLPPLPEQRRIVAKIEALSGASRRARDHLDPIPRLVETYKQALLAAAFKGDLTKDWRAVQVGLETAEALVACTPEPEQSRGGREATPNVMPGVAGLAINDPGTESPEGWAWVRLRRIARQETGHTPSRGKPTYWDGGIPWIGIRDAGAHHGAIIQETFQTVSEEGLANSSARLLPEGTVCLSRTASVGYVTIMGRPMATSQDFATWTCTEALSPRYLMYALMAEGEKIRDFGEGSTHTTIYFPEIRALHICLAPLAEQAEIVRRLEAAFGWIDRIAAEAGSARKLLDKLDQAVLAKVFRGELVPQDPADEPASLLLERIRKERAAQAETSPKAKRGRKAKSAAPQEAQARLL